MYFKGGHLTHECVYYDTIIILVWISQWCMWLYKKTSYKFEPLFYSEGLGDSPNALNLIYTRAYTIEK